MDNEKLEIVNLEPEATSGRYPWNADVNTKAITTQVLPIAAGVAGGAIAGYLLCHFVLKPIFAKIKANKEEAASPVVEEPKKEEE